MRKAIINDIKQNTVLRFYYNKGNINNRTIAIRAIVDDIYIVFCQLTKSKRSSYYEIRPIYFFEYLIIQGCLYYAGCEK